MKKVLSVIFGLLVLFPGSVFAVSENGQGSVNSSSGTVSSVSDGQTREAGNGNTDSVSSSGSQDQNQVQTQTQTQTNNLGTGTMSQTQTRTEAQIQQDIDEATPKYLPKNSKGIEQRSLVANAVQELVRTAAQIENKGIGDQIRAIAQTQIKNQDKIGQSIDKVETRSGFAKLFIGANYKELKIAKTALVENQNQIKELNQIMVQLTNDADKIAVANQIITLQQSQLELKDQVTTLSGGFSLFGWINRWKNSFSL